MNQKIDPQLIAIYFPQFHSIPENDIWWGKGFNDWQLVENAKPLFKEHNQPKIPRDGMYDPRDREVLLRQVKLAQKYGIHGFMFYHYWFDGKLMLEKPMETFFHNKDLNLKFCVCWANETWTRAWVGKTDILIEQKHTCSKDIWRKHFNYLLPFFKDDRAIKINDKPIFLIYQPSILRGTEEMFEFWQELATENGLPGIYFIAIKTRELSGNTSFLTSYDGLMKFQPREAYTSKYFKGNASNKFQILRSLPTCVWKYIRNIYMKFHKYTIINSDEIWKIILENAYKNPYPQYKLDIYESGYFEWDNTSRYKDKSKIFTRPDIWNMEKYLEKLLNLAFENKSELIFWNAWNEWSEGAYLEPDTKRDDENLKLLHDALNKFIISENKNRP